MERSAYLPSIISSAEPFVPTTDITLPGGVYNFSTLDIPAGVTVTAQGNFSLNVFNCWWLIIVDP